jgi:hypothetical protein
MSTGVRHLEFLKIEMAEKAAALGHTDGLSTRKFPFQPNHEYISLAILGTRDVEPMRLSQWILSEAI